MYAIRSYYDAGRSAFALAALNGRTEVRDLLRERGHEPDLHESALVADWERFEQLAEATPERVNEDHPIGGTAMHAIAIAGTGTSGWRVYAYGGDPDLRPAGRDFTPLRPRCVITSYSIHYTKLYEASGRPRPGSPPAPAPPARRSAAAIILDRMLRITSYNVCYTKLLRDLIGAKRPETVFHKPCGQCIAIQGLDGR